MEKKCPINNGNCCKTECAWFIMSTENTAHQKELNDCAVKLLALAKLDFLNKGERNGDRHEKYSGVGSSELR